jgi:hypothetical protein
VGRTPWSAADPLVGLLGRALGLGVRLAKCVTLHQPVGEATRLPVPNP